VNNGTLVVVDDVAADVKNEKRDGVGAAVAVVLVVAADVVEKENLDGTPVEEIKVAVMVDGLEKQKERGRRSSSCGRRCSC
jgi:hypothetical protein